MYAEKRHRHLEVIQNFGSQEQDLIQPERLPPFLLMSSLISVELGPFFPFMHIKKDGGGEIFSKESSEYVG